MTNPRKTKSEFFWARVRKTAGCWHWTGRKDPNGYGVVQLGAGEARTGAHRVSWELHNGELPVDSDRQRGTCVLHRCDNPFCVRPDHLFLGDRAANVLDAQQKGRMKADGYGWHRDQLTCIHGHSFNEANTYRRGVYRYCRQCRAAAERRRRTRVAEAPLHA